VQAPDIHPPANACTACGRKLLRVRQWRVFGWEYLRLSLIGLLASAGRIGQTIFLLYLLIAYSNPASSDTEVRAAGRR